MLNFNLQTPRGARHTRPQLVRGYETFQSTGSAGSPTIFTSTALYIWQKISIHGLRGEPDWEKRLLLHISQNFNPRAPRGARLFFLQKLFISFVFQSTGSAGSPTANMHKHGGHHCAHLHKKLHRFRCAPLDSSCFARPKATFSGANPSAFLCSLHVRTRAKL